jgi:hypothetical protein
MVGLAAEGLAVHVSRWATAMLGLGILFGLHHQHEAHADPPQFPDLSTYTPVDIAAYDLPITTPGRKPFDAYFFTTPDGITCNFISGQAQCRGNNFPNVPPAAPAANGAERVNWIGTGSQLKAIPASDSARPGPILPSFHKITVDGVTCGVDDKGTTACKDAQGRGFILSPAWSGWLPKV